ncbi:DNA polymerase III, chi subunit [Nitrosomonas cryotolerans]|uniref:DNA polymerase III, chi subunit n=1 Tax=Nitrosomonas cryotolerans ATCC 49181 TaxID=1131553 RepID=A0A1N6J0A4_9PROT|nr:DNA polymerase III subunit chi [Nitrosomonas cryotolerans]SFP54285.1 DNA polymerase III, chi subunit [Nitrosomonas cryotolerans]SIO37661.1 DNA polymerase III, chi subunit [Nitrosomonas cryotolerans ATCC 49181]
MTQIYFYSGSADKLHTACRLCTKALEQGFKVMIYTLDAEIVEQLNRLLWTFSPTGFIPHCHTTDELADVTPVLLGCNIEQVAHNDVLLNLHDELPPSFDRFQRLIEIAGTDEHDRMAARKRFHFYRKAGYEIHHHKLERKISECYLYSG